MKNNFGKVLCHEKLNYCCFRFLMKKTILADKQTIERKQREETFCLKPVENTWGTFVVLSVAYGQHWVTYKIFVVLFNLLEYF